MRIFDPLPRDIQEQARWGRLLNDPDWGAPPPATGTAKAIPFIDITDNYGSIRLFRATVPHIRLLPELEVPGGRALIQCHLA